MVIIINVSICEFYIGCNEGVMCMKNSNIDLNIENTEQKNNDSEIFENNVIEYSEGYEDAMQIPKELRKIRTQAYDKSVEDTVRMIEKGRIYLQPDFQRYSQVWDYKTASQLIESILLNVPIPPIYVAEEDDGSWNIIDGLQRLTSFKNFYEGKFKLKGLDSLKELNKQSYESLNPNAKSILDNGSLRIILITKESHPEMKYDVFMRLNRGSVKLTEQELRNCLYRGSLNDLIKDLRHNKKLLEILNLTEPHKRMDDAELILRYFALSENFDKEKMSIFGYKGIMKTFLNAFMDKNKNMTEYQINQLREKFNDTINKVYSIFGKNAFKRIEANGEFYKWTNKAIYDFIMLSFEQYHLDELMKHKEQILNALKTCVNENKEFEDSITVGTSEPRRMEYRLGVCMAKMGSILNDSKY